ncbi:MAG: hypothetical protein U0P45_07460 [Acidimicrobiales bacterium]
MQDPMAMANAMMAMQRVAAEQVAAAHADLAARGLGFGPELQREIAAQAAAHPTPTYDEASMQVGAAQVAQQAMSAVYPEDGFAGGDPRLEPIEGLSLPVAAIAARAVGWSTDEAFIARVATALGFEPATYERASAEWRARMVADVVLGAFYGQLFSQA